MNRAIVSLTAASLLALLAGSAGLSWAAEEEQADATVEYTGGSVALAMGYGFGKGVLHYKGMDYHFIANGLSIGDIGSSAATLNGKVFHLTRIEDFPGNYLAFTAGATFGGGGTGAAMRNQNGVIVHIGGTTAGLQFTLAPMGVAVTLDGPPTQSSTVGSTGK